MLSVAAPQKTCPACSQTFPLDLFYRNKSKFDGHEARCKECFRAAQRGELPRAPGHPERFWLKVDAFGDCWEWTASRYKAGYGMYMLNKRPRFAHRIAYEMLVGPVPKHLDLDHLCRNHPCVNPDHLEPVTRQEHVRRSYSPASLNARKTHCDHGHAFTPLNTYWYEGTRQCKTCRLVRMRLGAAKQRAAASSP